MQPYAGRELPAGGTAGKLVINESMRTDKKTTAMGRSAKPRLWTCIGLWWVCTAFDTTPLGLRTAGAAQCSIEQAIVAPPLSDLESRLFADIDDGRFGHLTLLEASLIAGGIDNEEELQRYTKRFNALVARLRASGKVRGSARQQAQSVFEFLHTEILRGGYNLQATDLRQAFDRGRFNCVSATVLFNCLAFEFKLPVVALQMPGHAMSRLELADESLAIETTCAGWFAKTPSPSAPLPKGERGDRGAKPRQISDVELVATIYYNRGVDLLAENRFAEATAANAKSLRLDATNATARGNFLATINNWAIHLGKSGNYADAAELLHEGLGIEPSYEAFKLNYVQVFREWSAELCATGHHEEALRKLTQAAETAPGEKFFRETAASILRRSGDYGISNNPANPTVWE